MTHHIYNIKNVFASLLIAATLCSCSDFLNQESQDEVIVHSVSDFSELLLGSGYPKPIGSASLYAAMWVLDDDYQLSDNSMYDDEDYVGATGAFALYTWQPNMWQDANLSATYFTDPYSATYERIMGVNAVLDGIDDATGSAIERDQVKAEALALRGYYYYMLVNLFAEPYCVNSAALGVPLKLTANTETNGRPRATVRQVYDQILEDLTGAAELFSKYEKRRGSYRINLPAVEILLTRVYLQMERWEDVVDAATFAIETGGAVTNYSSFTTYGSIASYDFSEVEWLYGNGLRPCTLSGMVASAELVSLFANNDKRKTKWIQSGYNNVHKHRLYNNKRTPTNTIRTSEAYVARAEANARLGNLTDALEDYNYLSSKRIASYSYKTLDDIGEDNLLNEILNERRRELCFDEVRWFDLRRLGMPEITHRYKVRKSNEWQTFTLNERDPLYTLPLPNEAILQNNQLTQNSSALQPLRVPSAN